MITRRALFAALAGLVAVPGAGQASIIDDAYVRKLFSYLRSAPPSLSVEDMVASGLFDVPKRWTA